MYVAFNCLADLKRLPLAGLRLASRALQTLPCLTVWCEPVPGLNETLDTDDPQCDVDQLSIYSDMADYDQTLVSINVEQLSI